MNNAIDSVVTKIDGVSQKTAEYIDSKSKDKHELMGASEDELTDAVIELFKEAAKIKTKGIA